MDDFGFCPSVAVVYAGHRLRGPIGFQPQAAKRKATPKKKKPKPKPVKGKKCY